MRGARPVFSRSSSTIAGANRDGVEATPTFIIDGEKVSNQPWDSMKDIIDTKLAEAAPAE